MAPHCFEDIKCWSIAPTITGGNARVPCRQLLDADIAYVRDPLLLGLLTVEQLRTCALVSHDCDASPDLCAHVIIELEGRDPVSSRHVSRRLTGGLATCGMTGATGLCSSYARASDVVARQGGHMAISGRCQCGSLTDSCDAEPVMTAICQCHVCQRQTGDSIVDPRRGTRRHPRHLGRDALVIRHHRRRPRDQHQPTRLHGLRITDRQPHRRDARDRIHHGRHAR